MPSASSVSAKCTELGRGARGQGRQWPGRNCSVHVVPLFDGMHRGHGHGRIVFLCRGDGHEQHQPLNYCPNGVWNSNGNKVGRAEPLIPPGGQRS